MQKWNLYLVRTADGALYTGIATDVERRLAEHRQGKGSKYLRSRLPLELVYQTPIGPRPLALRVEAQIKKLPKSEKEEIVAAAVDRERLLAILAVSPSEEKRPDEHLPHNPREGVDHGQSTSSTHSGGNRRGL